MLTAGSGRTTQATGEVRPHCGKISKKRTTGAWYRGLNAILLRRTLSLRASRFKEDQSWAILPSIGAGRAAYLGNIGYIVRLDTGEFVAKFKSGNICYTTPLISHGRVFCGSGDKYLYVIDLDSLSLVEKLYCGSRLYSSPRLNNGVVGLGSNGGIYREIDPLTLAPQTYLQVPDAITNAVSMTQDREIVYVPTYRGDVFAFRQTI
ncbi:PQQ-binding-like beta-propeller repeat protein [Bosea sp. R86505]|uniref:PQQ-binding-like beta-propeller repeat protein n=1 Tax=Bosea sp. R86505 TaxID=3101710 RepID=UPI00366B2DED